MRSCRAGARAVGNEIAFAPADEATKLPALLIAPSDPVKLGAANRALERLGVPWRFGAAAHGESVARAADSHARARRRDRRRRATRSRATRGAGAHRHDRDGRRRAVDRRRAALRARRLAARAARDDLPAPRVVRALARRHALAATERRGRHPARGRARRAARAPRRRRRPRAPGGRRDDAVAAIRSPHPRAPAPTSICAARRASARSS